MRRFPASIAILLVAACDAPGAPVAAPSYSMDRPAAPVASPRPAEREKCYGIAPAHANDGLAPPSEWREEGQLIADAGTATRDGQKNAWIYVPAGGCGARGGQIIPPGREPAP